MTRSPFKTRNSIFAALACAASVAAATASVPPEELAELQLKMRNGECVEVLERVASLEEEHSGDPDLLILGANCRLRGARSIEQEFMPEVSEQLSIANGMQKIRKSMQSRAFRFTVTIDEKIGKAALKSFEKALDAAPRRADIVVGIVALLVDLGRTDDAVDFLEKNAGLLDSESIDSIGRVVRDKLELNQLSTAKGLASGMSAVLGSSGAGDAALSIVAAREGRYLDAISHLESAVEKDPDQVAYKRELIRLQVLGRQYSEVLTLLVPMSNEQFDLRILLAIVRSGKSVETARPIWKSIAEDVSSKQIELNAEQRYVLRYFDLLLGDRESQSPPLRLRAARMLSKKGVEIAAISEAAAAAKADPRLLEAYVMIATNHSRAARFDLALAAADEAIEVLDNRAEVAADPSVERGELELIRARALVGLGRFDEALAAYDGAGALDWGVPIEHALCRLRTGDTRAAVKDLREIAVSNGEFAERAREKLMQLGESVDG